MESNSDEACCGWSPGSLSIMEDSQEDLASEISDPGSISFGRYKGDSLSWEKWSAFSSNKFQEEVEKLKNPGSVARKREYFEDYYKRIRALKGLQEIQQSELTLQYGSDRSSSCQSGEKQEIVVQFDSLANGATNADTVFAIEDKVQATLEKGNISSEVPQIGHVDPETTLSYHHGLFNGCGEEGRHKMNFGNGIQVQSLHGESTSHDSRSIDMAAQHDIIEDEGISATENSLLDCVPDVAAQGTKVSEVTPEAGDQKVTAYSTVPEPGFLESVPFKNNQAVKKQDEEINVQLKSLASGATTADNVFAVQSKVEPTLEKGKIINEVPQTGQLYPETTLSYHDLSMGCLEEGRHKIDCEPEVVAQESIESDVTHETGDQKTTACFTIPKPQFVETMPIKNKQVTKKQDNCPPVPGVKEFTATRNGLKLENKAKLDKFKSLHGPKHAVQKMTGKAEKIIDSSKDASNRSARSQKYTSVASSRSLTDMHSNVTIPRPFSFATERRAAAPSNKEVAKRSESRMPHRLASLVDYPKGVMNVQAFSKKTAKANDFRANEQENKRGQAEVSDKTLPLDVQSYKGRHSLVLESTKSRSINLTASDKSSLRGGNVHEPAILTKQNRQKQVKQVAKRGESQSVEAKLVVAPPNGGSRIGSKKAIPSSNSPANAVKQPQNSDQSLDGRNQRQEKPRWR